MMDKTDIPSFHSILFLTNEMTDKVHLLRSLSSGYKTESKAHEKKALMETRAASVGWSE